MLPSGWLLWVVSIEFAFLWVVVCLGIGNILFELTDKDKD